MELLKKLWMKKWLRWLSCFVLLILLLVLFRNNILKAMGQFLIVEDNLEKADALVILSGNAMDRATEGATLYKQGIAPRIICTGGNQAGDFEILHLKELESDMSRLRLLQLGVPDSAITVIHQGTSTLEEGDVMYNYCLNHHLKSCVVVSSMVHTRRINYVFDKKFKNAAVKIILHGAPPRKYDTSKWWKTEDGLMAVYDEYIKLIYYKLKY